MSLTIWMIINNRINEFSIHTTGYSTMRIKKLQGEWTSHTKHWVKEAKHKECTVYESTYIQQMGKTILFEIRMMVTKDTRRVLDILVMFCLITRVLVSQLCSGCKNSPSYTLIIICILFYIYTDNSIKKL